MRAFPEHWHQQDLLGPCCSIRREPHSSQPSSSSVFSPAFFSLPLLPVGAQQPESFIGYFTTACVAIVLAIFSYILLPRMVRLCCPDGEWCGAVGPLHIHRDCGPLAPQPWLLLSILVLRELSGILPTSNNIVGVLAAQKSISIQHKWKEHFVLIAFAPTCYHHTAPGSLLPSHVKEFSVAVSLQDFFRYYSMKDKTEYHVYNAELETKRDLIKKGVGRAERRRQTELNQVAAF